MVDWVILSKYGGVFLALVAAGFGLPIPEEIPIVTAGAMVGHDSQEALHDEIAGALGGGAAAYLTPELYPPPTYLTRWWIMLPLCILGVVICDGGLYGAGRLFGRRLLKSPWVRRNILPEEKQRKIEQNFHDRGIVILLAARLTPGIRSPIFIMAGVLKLPFRRFLLADAVYAIPGVNLLFWLAYLFTDQFVRAVDAVEKHRHMAILAVLSAVAGVVIWKFLSSWTVNTGSADEVPVYAKPVGVVTNAVEKAVELTVEKTKDVIDKVAHPRGHPQPPAPDVATSPPSAGGDGRADEPAKPVA